MKNCNYCNSCNSCNSCDSCDSCNSCNYCDSCNSCNYCKNLRMTEYNIFCYSEEYNDKESFQKERYRVFNSVMSKGRFCELRNLISNIIPNNDNLSLTKFWESISNNQWLQLLAIPEAKDFKKGFEYISGRSININPIIELTVKINGKESKLSEISEETLLQLRKSNI